MPTTRDAIPIPVVPAHYIALSCTTLMRPSSRSGIRSRQSMLITITFAEFLRLFTDSFPGRLLASPTYRTRFGSFRLEISHEARKQSIEAGIKERLLLWY